LAEKSSGESINKYTMSHVILNSNGIQKFMDSEEEALMFCYYVLVFKYPGRLHDF